MTRSVLVDSFREINSSGEFEYVKIRSVSEESSQFIKKKFLSNVLDSRTLRYVRTFKNARADKITIERIRMNQQFLKLRNPRVQEATNSEIQTSEAWDVSQSSV